jgi:hypothetical protein
MCRSATRRLAAGVTAALLTASTAHAQRFDAARREAVAAIPGLDVIMIRDTVLNACYTLFVMEPVGESARPLRADPASIPDLANERDRRLAALLAEYEQSQYAAVPGFPVPNPLRYAWEGNKVQSEYERRLRDKEISRLEEQLAHMASTPRLAVTGPVPCGAPPAPKK